MKKITSVFVVMLLLAVLVIPVFAVSGSVSLSASSGTLYGGDTFTVTARLVSSDAIALGTVKLNYDTSVFEMTGGTCHVSGAAIGKVVPGNQAGTFMLSGDPQVVSGNIFTFNMRVKEGAATGNYTISSSASIGVDNGVGISSGGVSVTVSCHHNYGAWEELESGHGQTCTNCGDVKTEAHKWDSGKETKPASCKEEGIKTYSCTVCKATKTETLPKTDDHVFGNLTAVDSNNHKDTCSVCQKEITQAHKWDGGKVTKPATCKEEGEKTLTCTGCKYSKTEIIEKLTTHTYSSWQNVDAENHKHICSVCAKEETAAHTWNSGTVTKKATCKEEGELTITCTGCGATKTEVIPVSDKHTWTKWEKIDDQTHKRVCTVCEKEETGDHAYKTSWSKDRNNHYHECSVCKDQKDVEKHIPGPAATETTAQTCKTCGYVIQAALGHTHDYAEEYTTDESGHWYTCAGCEEKGSYAKHEFENPCDPDCAVCGYTREAGHAYGEEWVTDTDIHYHVCAGCGDIQDQEPHTPGAEATETTAQTCTVCGYELAPALGVTEPTVPEDSVVKDGGNAQQSDFPWWIVIVAVVILGAAVVFVVVKKKR